MKLSKQQKLKISTLARVSIRTVENWQKSKPELIKILREKDMEEGDYVIISGSFFDDVGQRAFKVQKNDSRLCVMHSDGEVTYLDELPSWLYVKMDKTQFESDDNGLFL